MRICSLIPSGTEILFSLGLGDQVIGVTEYCNYPPEARSRPIVSRGVIDSTQLTSSEVDSVVKELVRSGKSTYLLDAQWLDEQRPDLILSQELCAVCDLQAGEVISTVEQLGLSTQVLVLSPGNLQDIFQNIRRVGETTGCATTAERLLTALQDRLDHVATSVGGVSSRPRVLCLEWLDPLLAAGHWAPEMVALAGGSPGLAHPGAPAQRLHWQEVLDYAPEAILLIPCAMDIAATCQEARWLAAQEGWWELPATQAGEVYAIYSDFFSVPGPRVINGLEVIAQLLHPESVTGLIPPNTVLKLDPSVAGCAPEELPSQFRPYP